MLRLTTILLILILPCFTHAQQAANEFRRIDITNGLPNNQVNTIFSDSRGFMWFATISGLNRFDGTRFQVFRHDPADTNSLPENSIHRIFEDHLGFLWLFNNTGTYFIYDPSTEIFSKHHPLFESYPQLKQYSISFIKADPDGNLWLGGMPEGIFFHDIASDEATLIKPDTNIYDTPYEQTVVDIDFDNNGNAYTISRGGVISIIGIDSLNAIRQFEYDKGPLYSETIREHRIFVDHDNDLWVYSVNSGDGIYFINSETEATTNITHISRPANLSHPNVTMIETDGSGKLWIGTEHGGVNILDKKDFSLRALTHIPGDATSLSANSITAICKGDDDIMWVGTFKNGVNYYHSQFFHFAIYRSQPSQEKEFFHNDVNCFAEDSKGNLWIGTNGEGLVYFDREANRFTQYRNDPENPNSISGNVIVSLYADQDDKLWIGTYLGGLNYFDGNRFTRFRHDPNDQGSLADDRIWDIHRHSDGKLWIATLGGGLDLYDEKSQSFIHHRAGEYNSVSSDFLFTLLEDKIGNLWIGTNNGLTKLEMTTGRFYHFTHDPDDSVSISNKNVLSLLEDQQGNIWVGTRNGLNLLNTQTNTFRSFTQTHGLPENNIISLQKDKQQVIWIATLNGISALTHDVAYTSFQFRNYYETDGLQGREFNEHASMVTSKGEIIFGGANGFNIFDPEDIQQMDGEYPVILSDFRLFNLPVKTTQEINGRVLLTKALNNMHQIRLKHFESVFSISFSALNFFQPERTSFRYMLEGFHNYWIETDIDNAAATFTNLSPGTYTLRVAASVNNGKWGPESLLEIVVIPPFYATQWAYGVYILLILLSILAIIVFTRMRENLKFARQQEKDEFERMRELDAMKTRFFTNVSHEFRTPLTMILTPVEKLLKETRDTEIQGQLTLINRNARRLLSLVNQLLDFRKLEVNRIHMNVKYGDIINLLRDSFDSFSDLFESKSIQHQFITNIPEYFVHFDADKVEKIVFNLLSNAIKFTPENGHILMELARKEPGTDKHEDVFNEREYFEIKVTDTGIGIAPERQKLIFDRFFQSDDHTAVINQGSGIGLSLALEFVKLHNGIIKVDSEPGKGSTFTVQMPLETYHESPSTGSVITTEKVTKNTTTSSFSDAAKLPGSEHRSTILIAEDNEDMRFYLKENLKSYYTVLEAANGNQAWDIIRREHTPDLIVSDIMMPGMSGLELCRKIKADTRTSHIPVILLTARTAAEQKMEGLEAGAEDYITKPFSYELLNLKIRRLIDLRHSFMKTFGQKFEIKPGEIGITSLDEKFLNKALKITEENIGSPDFSVEKMSQEIGVSRGHLYNKLVALTGKTPVEFIRIMRLKRAAQLLGKSQLTVSEVAYQVGFNDPKYFTKYFKEEFGMVPSEYARRNG